MNILGFSYCEGYFQTWGVNSRIRRIPIVGLRASMAVKWICGKLIGHSPSKTEWGYGGGGYGDVWCRWCNQIGSIPVSDLDKRFEGARNTIWNATGCDIRNGPADTRGAKA